MVSLAELASPRSLIEQAIQVELTAGAVDGIYIRQIMIPKADSVVPQHSHAWDHITCLARGSVFVWKDGALDKQYRAPALITIKAGVKHLFLTCEDETLLLCIHNLHDEAAVKVLEEHNLFEADTAA